MTVKAMETPTVIPNPELELAFEYVVNTQKSVFLTGKAGTGKTTFLHQLKSRTSKRFAVVAPTGVAAINAGGVTIHSFFQLSFSPFIPDTKMDPLKFNKDKINILQSLDLLIIDEISMVRCDVLDAIDAVLRQFKNRFKPFGGVQLLMIGDLNQLPPIIKDEEWELIKQYYPSVFFFNSNALQISPPVCIELKHIYRQKDSDFISILNEIRENKLTSETLVTLNKKFIPGFSPDEKEAWITLTSHNHLAQSINERKLNSLKGKAHTFKAAIENNFPSSAYPTEENLVLKEGAQVMFLKNDPNREKQYFNGKIGKITSIKEEEIIVQCKDDLYEIHVKKDEWKNTKYSLNKDSKTLDEETIGRFTQYPLKLAWAVTIHKSQGLTFDRVVIDAGASFTHGQVYVALSRCRTLEGIVLSSPIRLSSIKTDSGIAKYNDDISKAELKTEDLTDAKIENQKALLRDLFDFTQVKNKLSYSVKLVDENSGSIHSDALLKLRQILADFQKQIFEVNEKFKMQVSLLSAEKQAPEENEELQERIKKAAVYFEDKIQSLLMSPLHAVEISTDNKTVLDNCKKQLEITEKEMYVQLRCFENAKQGFTALGFQQAKANAEIDFQSSFKKKTSTAGAANAKSKHPILFQALAALRDELAIENNVEPYVIFKIKTLTELSEMMPLNQKQLKSINGIGSIKIKKFGGRIIDIISDYCKDNNLSQQEIEAEIKSAKPDKTASKYISLEMFKSGKTIRDIAQTRNFAVSTIEGHLAQYVASGELDVSQLLSEEKIEMLNKIYAQTPDISRGTIMESMGSIFSYPELAFYVAFRKSMPEK